MFNFEYQNNESNDETEEEDVGNIFGDNDECEIITKGA